jgi:hypothetical protein
MKNPTGTKLMILSPLVRGRGELGCSGDPQQGFVRRG